LTDLIKDMGFSGFSKALYFIKNLYKFKGYGSNRLIREFSTKKWKKNDFWNIWKNIVDYLEAQERPHKTKKDL